MVASASFAEFLRELPAPLGHITLRRMFGKTGVFCDGLMLGMVTEAASSPPLSNNQLQACAITK